MGCNSKDRDTVWSHSGKLYKTNTSKITYSITEHQTELQIWQKKCHYSSSKTTATSAIFILDSFTNLKGVIIIWLALVNLYKISVASKGTRFTLENITNTNILRKKSKRGQPAGVAR